MRDYAQPQFSLAEIVERFGGELVGDGSVAIRQVATLSSAGEGHFSFLANPKYRSQLSSTGASAVVVAQADKELARIPHILSTNPYAYYARVAALLNPPDTAPPGIHATAVVGKDAEIAASASIGPNVVVGDGAVIGEYAQIGAGCFIGAHTEVGTQTRFYPNVTVYHGCLIGERTIVHSGAVIGSDGFGLANEKGCWLKIPQIGRVRIGNDVEIGANTTIDRGALDDTVIEDGVKLDNQIQIAHNVHIGAHTAMAGCVGVAGSTRIGSHCTVAGSAMIIGHLEIADRVNISVGTLVTKSINQPGTYTSSIPSQPHRDWLKNAAQLHHLTDLAERVKQLEQKLSQLEGKSS
ncbi:MAG: UDP-3-O-(3-hydroxymyristoyl)glucosamine N-acyltransferase [Sulfuricella sp.]|nr:UDP-3-O-(3-hydroxymyristoyl)glucosamine N-acyltransferase [Sulfuricella sp.]